MKKIVPILTVLFLLSLPCLAYDGDYDDDTVSTSEAFRVILYGAGVMLVGYIISQVSWIKGLGQLILGLGAFAAFVSLFMIVMNIVAAVVSVAVKIALVVGAIALGIWILRGIYFAIAGKENVK